MTLHSTNSAFARLQMTGAHNFFRLYALSVCDHAPAQRHVEGFDLVFAVCHSNHHTLRTASWQNHDSSSPSLLLYCTAMFAYVYQTPTFPPHCGDNVKYKHSTFTRLWISPSCSGVGVKQWLQMTGALFIAYDALRINI